MIRFPDLLIGVFLLIGWVEDNDRGGASFVVADTILTKLKVICDSSGLPDGYQATIYTPVCEEERCYAIEVVLFWDLIGDFQKFDTIPGKGLTKLDHIPFTSGDYDKLSYILSNSNSALGLYAKNELVRNTRSSSLDGITGATVQEITNSVINGAVYSCYTLWHIAHGAVKDSIRNVTVSSFSKDLVKKLVNQNDQNVNYFLIKHFSSEDFIRYLPEVVRCLEVGEGYFTKNAFERIPAQALVKDAMQGYLIEHFSGMNYFDQVALLRKLEGINISEELAKVFESSLNDRNSYRDELIQRIIDFNENDK